MPFVKVFGDIQDPGGELDSFPNCCSIIDMRIDVRLKVMRNIFGREEIKVSIFTWREAHWTVGEFRHSERGLCPKGIVYTFCVSFLACSNFEPFSGHMMGFFSILNCHR